MNYYLNFIIYDKIYYKMYMNNIIFSVIATSAISTISIIGTILYNKYNMIVRYESVNINKIIDVMDKEIQTDGQLEKAKQLEYTDDVRTVTYNDWLKNYKENISM